MKKFGLILSVLVMTSLSLWAQGGPDSPDCTLCIRLADNVCKTTNLCYEAEETCNSTSFTAPCDTTVDLTAWMYCSNSTNCSHCLACAWLTYNGTRLGGTITHNDCTTDCDYVTTGHRLQCGKVYTLFVCKRLCEGGECEDCQDCVAWAELKFPGSTCPSW